MFEPKKPFAEPSYDMVVLSQDDAATSSLTGWNTHSFNIDAIQKINE